MNAKATQLQAPTAENIESEIERMRQLAQSSSASAELLRNLSASQDRLVRQTVAANPNTPTKILFELGREFPKQLLDNPLFSLLPLEYPNLVEILPIETLTRLLECDRVPHFLVEQVVGYPSASVSYVKLRKAIASNFNTPVSTIERLTKDRSRFVRAAVVSNSNTPIPTLEQLAKDKDWFVRQAVAINPKTPVLTLEELFRDQDKRVRLGVASNSNTPVPTLEQLAKDEDKFVRAAVARNPNTSLVTLKRLVLDEDWEVNLAIAENSKPPVPILQEWLREGKLGIRLAVAQNSATPAVLLEQLVVDEAAIEHFDLPTELLQYFARDNIKDVNLAVANHPNVPVELLKKLAQSRDRAVREAAEKHLCDCNVPNFFLFESKPT